MSRSGVFKLIEFRLMKQNVWDINIYLEIVKRRVSDFNDRKVQVFDDGWDFVVIVIDSMRAFRFPKREDYAKKLPIETRFLEFFADKSPVRVPKFKYQKDEISGMPYVTYDFIPGVRFSKSLSRIFSKNELLATAKQMGAFLTAVHSFPVETARQLGIQQIDFLDAWQKRLAKIKQEVFPRISEYEQKWIVKLFENFLEVITKTPIKPVVTHSDIMPEHIIVDPETHRLSGIIDFGDILIADPAYDFTLLADYGGDFLRECYRNYGLPRDETFDARRKFYRHRQAVTNLEHSLKLGDKERIMMHKRELSEYIKSHQAK